MKKSTLTLSMDAILLAAMSLSIPAFYLVLTGVEEPYRIAGHGLYGVVAVILAAAIAVNYRIGKISDPAIGHPALSKTDLFIVFGAAISALPTEFHWSVGEWLLRLGLSGIVFIRISILAAKYIHANRLLHIVALAIVGLAISGLGFLWLEPKVHTYADGVWLAFTTGATVGYGDIVPSTPASRVFAIFIVMLGYALFSIVTASIAALLVGEDEKRIRRELHADMRILREEIASLRAELRQSYTDPARIGPSPSDARGRTLHRSQPDE